MKNIIIIILLSLLFILLSFISVIYINENNDEYDYGGQYNYDDRL